MLLEQGGASSSGSLVDRGCPLGTGLVLLMWHVCGMAMTRSASNVGYATRPPRWRNHWGVPLSDTTSPGQFRRLSTDLSFSGIPRRRNSVVSQPMRSVEGQASSF
jgi:hypothetical protein